jgi:hypothetical protein
VEFLSELILPVALWPCGRLSLYQKLVPGILPGGKDGRCVGLTLPISFADCLEILEPEPPGTPRACNGIALPFYRKMNVFFFGFGGFCAVCEVNLLTTFRRPLWVPSLVVMSKNANFHIGFPTRGKFTSHAVQKPQN